MTRRTQGNVTQQIPQYLEATAGDVFGIYQFALTIPELAVMPDEPFMTLKEFQLTVPHPNSICYWARGTELPLGFILAKIGDVDGKPDSACIVYIAVDDHCRRYGIATTLLNMAMIELQKRGVQSVYAWADEKSGVVEFLDNHGFGRGKRCVWMQSPTDTVIDGEEW